MTTFKFSRSMLLLCAIGVLTVLTRAAIAQGTPNPAPLSATEATVPSGAPATAQVRPALEPKAIEILKATCTRLAAAHSMEFTAVETFENPSRLGFPLAYATKSDVLLQRPDKLRVITSGDGPVSEFYYDGKTMLAFAPAENLVAVADAPPAVDEMLGTAYHSAAIYFAFDDMIVSDPYKDIAQDMQVAFYVGQSKIVGDTTTDIVAYESGGVFIEAWIGAEDKLPRLIRAIYVGDPSQSRHVLVLTHWQLDQTVPADAFGTTKTASAKRIPFAAPDRPPGSFKPVDAATSATKPTTNP
jgi:hypothetical protein